MTAAEFFEPTLIVASWVVGVLGGFVLGMCTLLLIVILAAAIVYVLFVLFCKVVDELSSYRHKRAMRRLREKT